MLFMVLVHFLTFINSVCATDGKREENSTFHPYQIRHHSSMINFSIEIENQSDFKYEK